MIKKILVALDQDSDTPVATQYAIQIARHTDARLTGLAVVDTKEIQSSSRGGGIGSMYYAEKLKENLTAETRKMARGLINTFEKRVEQEGIMHAEAVEEGVSFERIVEDMKYHDLLVLGLDPHFFYGHPNKNTNTLAGIFHKTIGPTLLVPPVYNPVKKVLFASDGSNHSARTLHSFIHLAPFGHDVTIDVLHVHPKDSQDSELHLELTKGYLNAHGFEAKVISVIDKTPEVAILEQAELIGADLIVSGGTAHTGLTGTKFGKTTSHLVEHSTLPLFVDH
jgi:nucleotide-binding universal stress UspA family protein